MKDSRKKVRLNEGASMWSPIPLISAERWEQLQKEHAGFLRLKQVVELTRKSKTQIYADGRAGTFPMRVHAGPNFTAWKAADVFAWIESRPYACETI